MTTCLPPPPRPPRPRLARPASPALPTNAPFPRSGRQVAQLVLMLPEIEIQPKG